MTDESVTVVGSGSEPKTSTLDFTKMVDNRQVALQRGIGDKRVTQAVLEKILVKFLCG